MKLLMVHGNGGATARFKLFMEEWARDAPPRWEVVLPEISGFEGRPLPPETKDWRVFLEDIGQTLRDNPTENWVLYGHGIGGSILLEAARRGWDWGTVGVIIPKQVILHGPIGATLSKRWFPKLMQPKWVRSLMKRMVANPTLRPLWEKRLFLHPQRIPQEIRTTFFNDYARCDAFSLFFDLITPDWYQQTQQIVKNHPFHFLWGAEERVVASKFVTYWEQDFPASDFQVIDGWDHFPMLDTPEDFFQFLKEMILSFNLDNREVNAPAS